MIGTLSWISLSVQLERVDYDWLQRHAFRGACAAVLGAGTAAVE
jgi:hypothetical protein